MILTAAPQSWALKLEQMCHMHTGYETLYKGNEMHARVIKCVHVNVKLQGTHARISHIRILIRREQEGKDSLTRSSGSRNANQMQVSINSTSVQYWSDIVTLLLNFGCCLHVSYMCD